MLQLQFTPFPKLLTERLILRQLDIGDAQAIFDLRTDERVNQFLDRPKPEAMEDVRKFIEKILEGISKKVSMYWVIALKNDPKMIGSILFWNISPENERAEIGYELHPDFQGKGIMQEALSAVVDYGFEKMGLKTILAYSHAHNVRSISILERNSFERQPDLENIEGLLNMAVYALNR